jgi:hypothetical protein
VATVTIVTTTVTFVVAFVSASSATASSVVSLSFAKRAAPTKSLTGATNTGLNNWSLQSGVCISVLSQQICTNDFHCRGEHTSTVEISLLSGFIQIFYDL